MFENVLGFLKMCKASGEPPLRTLLRFAEDLGVTASYDIRVVVTDAAFWLCNVRRRIWIIFTHHRAGGEAAGDRTTENLKASYS